MLYSVYCLVIVVVGGLSWSAARRPQRSKLLIIAVSVNIVACISACLTLCVFALGTLPAVQFNVGRQIAMWTWSAWVSIWPFLLLTLLLCIMVSIVLLLCFVGRNFRWSTLAAMKVWLLYLVLTIVHCCVAFYLVFYNFPDA